MAIRVSYTHAYDRSLTILRFITGFMWFVIVAWALSATGKLLGILGIEISSLEDFLPDWLNVILTIILLISFFTLAIYLHSITTNRWIGTLSAWLYIRYTLKTHVSFADATKVSWLFVPNETGKWYPMKELLQIPQERRRTDLLAKATEIASRLIAEETSGKRRPVQQRG